MYKIRKKIEILKDFLTISSVTKTVSLKLYASKAMLSKNQFYFLSHPLTCKGSTIYYNVTLLELIPHLSFLQVLRIFQIQYANPQVR